MSDSKEHFSDIGDHINKIATESVLGEEGSDAGLIPCYCLVDELRNMSDMEPFSAAASRVAKSLDARLSVEPT